MWGVVIIQVLKIIIKIFIACNKINREIIWNIIFLIWIEKNIKLVKQSEIITQQLKAVENTKIVDIKSVIIKHPKTWHKLSKTKTQTE